MLQGLRTLNSRQIETGIAGLIAAVVFIVYLTTLCPTTNFIDSGELSTVAYTLGIAHPTGYPLFALVGWIFAHLPLGMRVVYQLNLMAAFFCSAALFVFFKFLVFFLRSISAKELKKENSEVYAIYLPASVGTLFLGFSETFWSQATAIEVYSLHCFLVALLLLLYTKAVWQGSDEERTGGERRYAWYAFAFVLGLAFTNHMTTILLAPAFLYLYFYTYRLSASSMKRLGRLVLPFLLGFSLYLYLPIRVGEHPIMSWGNPADLEHFWWHFTGKQYRVWIFSSSESAMKQLQYFIDTLSPEFAYVAIAFACVGIFSLLKRSRVKLVFSVLLFIGCVAYAINYDIHDIDSYFLLAYFTVALWSAVGCQHVLKRIRRERVREFAGAASVLLACMVGVVNYHKVDESDLYLVEDYTHDMFKSIEPNGIVMSYQWDYFVSAAYYFQIVEKERPDVVVIDKELLRRSWYYKQLETRYPWLIRQSQKEVDEFLAELYKFEHDLPYDPAAIEGKFNRVIHSFISRNYGKRPVYATGEIESQYTSGYNKVPSGLGFRLYADTLNHQVAPLNFSFRMPARSDKYTDGIATQYAKSYVNHALYAFLSGRKQEALDDIGRALLIEPTMTEAIYLRERILQGG